MFKIILLITLSLSVNFCFGALVKGPTGKFFGPNTSESTSDIWDLIVKNFLSLADSDSPCGGHTWSTCPAGTGISSQSPKYPNCCPGKSDYYCPDVARECIPGAGGCCQTGFDYYCSSGDKRWCCSENYPICGYDGGCYSGSCSCGVCSGSVDPCQFQDCGDTCKSCCDLYSGVCQGPAKCVSSSGFAGVKLAQADPICSS